MVICEPFLFQAVDRVAILAIMPLFVDGRGAPVALDFIDLYFLPLGHLPEELTYVPLSPVNITCSTVYPTT